MGGSKQQDSTQRYADWYIPSADGIRYTGSADSTNAAITQAQYDYYEANFKGREKQFIGSILDGSYYEGVIPRAGADARDAYSRGEKIADRSLSRYGAQVTPEQRELLSALRAQGRALAGAGAQNDARDVIHDVRLDVIGNLTNIGRGVRTAASQGIGQAAGLQASRDATNRQLAAQGKASTLQGAVGGAALGWTIGSSFASLGSFGGPIGALGGAVLAGLVS